MINIPVLRWGEPYESLETNEVIHHRTGEVLATVGQANPGLLARDMRKANRAREALREIPIKDLVEMMKKAGDLYLNETLPLGDGEQTLVLQYRGAIGRIVTEHGEAMEF